MASRLLLGPISVGPCPPAPPTASAGCLTQLRPTGEARARRLRRHVALAGDPLGRGAAGPRAPPPTRGGAAICFLRPDAGVSRDPGAVRSSTRGQPAKKPRLALLSAPRPPPLDPGAPRKHPYGCQRADTWPVGPAGTCWPLLSPDPPSRPHSLPSSQHAGEKRGVAGLLLGRTERAARAAELQLCAQAR